MVSNNIDKEFWWIRTPSAGLTIGQLCLDSEGSRYFIDVRNPERVYDGDDVAPVVRTQQPADKTFATSNLASARAPTRNNSKACGSRVLSFNGWTKFWCGKCPTCRVQGRVAVAAKSNYVRGARCKRFRDT